MESYLPPPKHPRLPRKPQLHLFLTLLLAALIAGCGSSEPIKPTSGDGAVSAAAEDSASAETAAAGDADATGTTDLAVDTDSSNLEKATESVSAEPEFSDEDRADPYAAEELPPAKPLPPPKDAERLSPEHRIWISKSRGEVIIDTLVSFREGYLEMFACKRNTKEHESILSADTQAFLAHAGLLSLGAESGTPVQFVPEYAPPTGAEILITVEWLDTEGKMQSARAQEWVRDVRTQKEMDQPWVFAGSFFVQDEQTGQRYYVADQDGELICVSNFSTAMLDVPAESTQANDGLLFEAFTERIPPLGTPVRMILKPKAVEKEAK